MERLKTVVETTMQRIDKNKASLKGVGRVIENTLQHIDHSKVKLTSAKRKKEDEFISIEALNRILSDSESIVQYANRLHAHCNKRVLL